MSEQWKHTNIPSHLRRADTITVEGKISFPLDFNLRVIMERQNTDQETRILLENMLLKANIGFRSWKTKSNPESKYVRFKVGVHIKNEDTMKRLYRDLDREPNVKAAI
jgi:putative lipoic acid-binding regulatory protein